MPRRESRLSCRGSGGRQFRRISEAGGTHPGPSPGLKRGVHDDERCPPRRDDDSPRDEQKLPCAAQPKLRWFVDVVRCTAERSEVIQEVVAEPMEAEPRSIDSFRFDGRSMVGDWLAPVEFLRTVGAAEAAA